jgi:sulfatase maturation enzyme AslB (radical SAM superfamily)
MHNAYMVRGNIMDKDYYCLGYKMLFNHITNILHKELKGAEVKK